MKIEILRGMSCSGKSTYAKRKEQCSGWFIVSRDEIRKQLLGEEKLNEYFQTSGDWCLEEEVTKKEQQLLAKLICKKKNIIIDNTNLKKKYVQEYINIFYDLYVECTDVSLVDFPISLEEAKERSKTRYKKINDEIIEKQFEQFKSLDWNLSDFRMRGVKDKDCWMSTRDRKKWYFTSFDIEPYRPKQGSFPAIIVDIDGTLAHRKVVDNKLRSFYDYEKALTDYVDPSIKWLLENIQDKCQIIIVSGRMDSSFMNLVKWLEDNVEVSDFLIYMRKDQDRRSDDIVKYEIFNEHIRDVYAIKFVIDDRDRVCAMWQELGLKVFNVGDLNEHF